MHVKWVNMQTAGVFFGNCLKCKRIERFYILNNLEYAVKMYTGYRIP